MHNRISHCLWAALVLGAVFGMYQHPAFLWMLATQAWLCF
jgi:hypothetical protein